MTYQVRMLPVERPGVISMFLTGQLALDGVDVSIALDGVDVATS